MTDLPAHLDLTAYARRLGLPAPTLAAPPSLDLLRQLHRHQPEAIAFENLSPLLGLPVPLGSAELAAKLLHQSRGGYCFELNSLFLRALRQLGFTARGLAARVHWQVPPGVVLPRTHMLILVELAGESWLADVGFGGLSLTAPLRLLADEPQSTPHNTFRLLADTDEYGHGYCLQVQLGERWVPMYSFDLQVQQEADFVAMNWFVATHPSSRFTTQLVAARVDGECRHTLGNAQYTCHRPDGSERRQLQDVDELLAVLDEVFGLPVRAMPGVRERLLAVLTSG